MGKKKPVKRGFTRRARSKGSIKVRRRIRESSDKYIRVFKDIPYIFNLGHGLLPKQILIK